MPFSPLIFPDYVNEQEGETPCPQTCTPHHSTLCSRRFTPILRPEFYSSRTSILMKKEVKYLRKEKWWQALDKSYYHALETQIWKIHWNYLSTDLLYNVSKSPSSSLGLIFSSMKAEGLTTMLWIRFVAHRPAQPPQLLPFSLVSGTHMFLGVCICIYFSYKFQIRLPLAKILNTTYLEISQADLLDPRID